MGEAGILTLKFGCRILYDGQEWTICSAVKEHKSLYSFSLSRWIKVLNIGYYDVSRKDVLGRDITLADVMMAINEQRKGWWMDESEFLPKINVTSNGEIFTLKPDYARSISTKNTLDFLWDFKDPLHRQPQDLIDWLCETLEVTDV